MGRDKKSLHGRLRFVLPDAIGRVELVDGVDPAAVERVLSAP
jgi:3-dehydroquinate synthetase